MEGSKEIVLTINRKIGIVVRDQIKLCSYMFKYLNINFPFQRSVTMF